MPADGLSSLSLHQLRVFAAVARQRSFARAADALYLSQPTVSEQIKTLEHLVGVKLLNRHPGRGHVEMTEAGRVLLQSCDEVSQTLERAAAALQAFRGVEHGAIAFGAGQYYGGNVLPEVYDAFRRTHPAITFRIEVGRSHVVLENVLRRRLDLAVVVLVDSLPVGDLTAEPLGRYDVVLVGPPNHPLANRRLAPFSVLATEPLILPDRHSRTRRVLEQMAAQADTELQVAMEVNNVEAQAQGAAIGLGVTALNYAVVAPAIAAGRLSLLHVEGFPARFQYSLVYRRGQLSPAAETFRQHLRQHGTRPARYRVSSRVSRQAVDTKQVTEAAPRG